MISSKVLTAIPRTLCLLPMRQMARGRNYYLKGASVNPGISPQTRDLLANVKHAENIEEWEREPGIGSAIKFSHYRENPLDIDDESELDMTYFPHKGEEPWPKDYEASPVLLVKRVKKLKGEPWWHKMDCERIGLGIYARLNMTRVALPNLSFYNALLFRIKHLVEIQPVTFPDGIPKPEEFDVRCAKVTESGEFLYHKKIGEASKVLLGEGPIEAEHLKMDQKTHEKESYTCWGKSSNSPYGNSNYHRDYTLRQPGKSDMITDASNKITY